MNTECELFNAAISLLKKRSGRYKDWAWTDGEQIMCKDERTAEFLADLIDSTSDVCYANTSYYDPNEDERSGEVDEYTGWWCVTID